MSHICPICEFWMSNKEADTHDTEACKAMVEAADVLTRNCSVMNCTQPRDSRGWCRKHYEKWRWFGDPLGSHVERKCSVDGCDNKHKALGYCVSHYRRCEEYRSRGYQKRDSYKRKRQEYLKTPKAALRRHFNSVVNNAKASGQLVQTVCEMCGVSDTNAHHDSYMPNYELVVRWLCHECHRQWHISNSPIYPHGI